MDICSQIIQLAILLVTILALWNSFCTSKEALKKSTELSSKLFRNMLFVGFTKRYEEWLLKMPSTMFMGEVKLGDEAVLRHIQLYFDLCSEEYYMRKKGMIDDEVWQYWVEGMRDTFKRFGLKTIWQGVLGQYYNDDFSHFVNQEVLPDSAPHQDANPVDN